MEIPTHLMDQLEEQMIWRPLLICSGLVIPKAQPASNWGNIMLLFANHIPTTILSGVLGLCGVRRNTQKSIYNADLRVGSIPPLRCAQCQVRISPLLGMWLVDMGPVSWAKDLHPARKTEDNPYGIGV